MSEQKAVLWDLDGTVLDSLSVAVEIFDEIFPALQLPPLDRETIRTNFYGSLEDSLLRMSDNYHDQPALFKAFNESQQRHYEDPVFHIGIREAITALGELGLKQAIVTSRGNAQRGAAGAHAIVKNTKLDDLISVVISADETVAHKPDPEPLLLALEKLDVTPYNTVMIGDQPVDTQAANAAGVHSILIDHENTQHSQAAMRGAQPNLICTDAGQALAGVRQLLNL